MNSQELKRLREEVPYVTDSCEQTDGVVWQPTYDNHGEPMQERLVDTSESIANLIVYLFNHLDYVENLLVTKELEESTKVSSK